MKLDNRFEGNRLSNMRASTAAVTHSAKDTPHKAEKHMQMYMCICERSRAGETLTGSKTGVTLTGVKGQ